MRKWSSAYRYAYKRLLEDKNINDLRKGLQDTFGINSRYSYSAIVKAQTLLSAVKEKGENTKKIIFGCRASFEKLKQKHINGKPYKKLQLKWIEKRKGSLNTRIEVKENNIYLNVG